MIFLGTLVANGQKVNLSDFQWKNRIILLNVEDRSEEIVQQQLQLAQDDGYAERDLILLVSQGKQMYDSDLKELNFEIESLQSIVGNATKNMLYLIGKDGGMKLRQTLPVPNADIFDLIDSMPMRRAEMKKGSRN